MGRRGILNTMRVVTAARRCATWALVLVACTFDTAGGADGAAASLGAATTGSDDGPTLTTAATTTTGTISEATEDSTAGDASMDATSAAESSEDTEGATEDGGEVPLPLDDAAVLVRYYLDEAHQGSGPTHALDSIVPRLDLAYGWEDGMSYGVDGNGNRGLSWADAEQDGGPAAMVRDTKVREALEGATAATIELVTDARAVASAGGSRFLAIGHGNSDVRFGLLAESSHQVGFRWRNNKDAAFWDVELPAVGRAVFHVVLETTAAEDDRLRLYVNGVKLPVIKGGGDWPSDGQSIDFHNDSVLMLGNRPPGDRSFEGVLYYAAVYATAFDDNRIAHHVAVLDKSDDAP